MLADGLHMLKAVAVAVTVAGGGEEVRLLIRLHLVSLTVADGRRRGCWCLLMGLAVLDGP